MTTQESKPATIVNTMYNTTSPQISKPAKLAHLENSKLPATSTLQEVTTEECATKPLINTYKIHPVANTLHRYDIIDLVDSIKTHGQIDPVLLWRSSNKKALQLINGRHRMWACNELGLKVKYQILECKEEDLPNKILDQQLLSRGTDKVFATITLMEYLTNNKGTASALIKKYSNLAIASRDIGDAKTIAKLMPTWITALKIGKGIKIDSIGHAEIKSLRTLAKACKDLELLASTKPEPYEYQEATPEGIAYSKAINALRAVMATDNILTDSAKKSIYLRLASEIQAPASIDTYETHEDYGELLI